MEKKLQEYAKLLIEVGLNVQKGQTLFIRAPYACAPFVQRCAKAAYDAGCREVIAEYGDDRLTRMKYLHADGAVFDECPAWMVERQMSLVRQNAAFLHIAADDPDTLKGVDPDRIRRNAIARGNALREYQQAVMENRVRWCIASVPTASWAKRVFPGKTEEQAVEALWDAILKTMRVTGEGDAVDLWRAHVEQTEARCQKLNALKLSSLRYQNSLGTDLTVELPEGALWLGGSEKSRDGIPFIANMPTEEIFTAPKRTGVNGRVVSSMPFVLSGNLIERFAFTIKDGAIETIEASSEAEHKLLSDAISVDEGAKYLGEVALVPYDSPISQLGILFYNTLFDENASCHFAFGEAYPCLENAKSLTEEEKKSRGINQSITHQDFMVGTRDLSITGITRDGREVPVFVNGNFAL